MRLNNSIRIDGSVFVSRGDRVVWHWSLPERVVRCCVAAAEWMQ